MTFENTGMKLVLTGEEEDSLQAVKEIFFKIQKTMTPNDTLICPSQLSRYTKNNVLDAYNLIFDICCSQAYIIDTFI